MLVNLSQCFTFENGIRTMKKHLWIINLILLIINILLFLYFSVYTIISSKPFGNFITNKDIEFQFVFSLIYEFIFFAISWIISKVLNKDLSFKGTDVLKLIPKSFILIVGVIIAAIIIYTFILKMSVMFLIMCIFMLFSILIEYGIIKYFRY